jgi:hypothetical protein
MLAPVHVAPFPFTTAISDRVGSALETALMRHGDAKTEFRSSVEACVQSLKRQGMLKMKKLDIARLQSAHAGVM